MSNATYFNFHGIGNPIRQLDPGEINVWLERNEFTEIVQELSVLDKIKVTFDDGNISDLKIGLPELLKRKLKGCFFVIVDRIGKAGFLGIPEIRELINCGMEIGSHGMSHRSWISMDESTARIEIIEAKDKLEQLLGINIRKAACPFGTYDRRSLLMLKNAGFDHVFTSDGGKAKPHKWLQPRNTIHRGDTAEKVRSLLEESPWGQKALLRKAKCLVKRFR